MKEQVRSQLKRLREEIDALPKEQAAARSQLDEIVSDIESELDGSEPKGGTGLLERIRRIVGEFEVEHPKATAILNDISAKLGSMGI